ncbi:MAG: FG-GAP-like repeat-containing protein, partial [Candidatus Hodarchaeota archaeon]
MIKLSSLSVIILFVLGALVVNDVASSLQTEEPFFNENKEESIILKSASTKYYSNGLAVPHNNAEINRKSGSNSSHPLTRNMTNILPLEEVAIFPLNYPGHPEYGTGPGWILDDSINNFTKVFDIPIEAAYPLHSFLGSGDFDGDGLDEVVVVEVNDGVGYIISMHDYANGTHQIGFSQLFLESGYQYTTAAFGDLDADGVDEVVLGKCNLYVHVANIWTWDILENKTLGSTMITNAYTPPNIGLGDFDGDGADEFFIEHAFFSYLSILDDPQASFNVLKTHNFSITSEYIGNFAIGDFDADYFDEIVIEMIDATNYPPNYEMSLVIMDDATTLYWESELQYSSLVQEPTHIITGDFDGDNTPEIGYFGFTATNDRIGLMYNCSPVSGAYNISKTWSSTSLGWIHETGTSTFRATTVGDLDCDGKDEIVVSDTINTVVLDDAESDYAYLHTNADYKGQVVCGDFDADGVKANYTGRFWEGESPPGVVVVLAAPPTQYGIDQNYRSSYTAYGTETSIGEAQGNQIGVVSSATTSYGFDIDIGIQFIGFELFDKKWGETISRETVKTKYHTKLLEIAGSYATGSDHDSVVYHLTTYHCYEYQIVSHPFDSELIGKNITIDIPISSALHKGSVPYFNGLFGDSAPKIGNETFNHTIGKPWTYPSLTDMGTIAPIRWQSSEEWVGQGSGWTNIQIKVTEQQSASMTMTTTTENYDSESVGGSYGYENSKGSITGNIYEVIVGESCIYEGV